MADQKQDSLALIRQMLDALKAAQRFALEEQAVREASFLPEPSPTEEDDLADASETVDGLNAAIKAAEDYLSPHGSQDTGEAS